MVELKGNIIVQVEIRMAINLRIASNGLAAAKSKIITSLLRYQLCDGLSDCSQTSEGTLT